MLAVAREFGIARTYTMCFPDDIPVLRQRFGNELGFNGSIMKKLDEPDDVAYRLLDRFLRGLPDWLHAGVHRAIIPRPSAAARWRNGDG